MVLARFVLAWLLTAVVAAVLAAAPTAARALETAAQQKCLHAVNKGFAKVSKAEGKEALSCLKAAARGELAPATMSDCIAADPKQKIAGARAKAEASIAKACAAEAPSFGVADLTGAATAAAGAGRRTPLLAKFFGDAIEAALVAKDADADGAKCQAALARTIHRCWEARVAAFASCAKDGLETGIEDAAALGACRDADPKGAVAKACSADVAAAVEKKCAGADLDALLPGCECQSPVECVRARTANSANAALEAAANLPEAAPVLPYARRKQTSVGEPWISPVYGEFVASRVVGREEDAPLTCPLGAVNIYTIQDLVADAEYNAAIFPLLMNQGVRVLFQPGSPTDLTGSSPVGLVQGTQAMPLYGGADDFLRLSTRYEVHDLAPLKHAQVGDTLHFAFEHCLFDCDAIYAFDEFPPIVFGTRLLVVHFSADRSTIEDAVGPLASEAALLADVQLRWVGRTVADFRLELPDGTTAQAFHRLEADGTVVYELGPSVDPVADVLSLPVLAGLLGEVTGAAVVLLE